MKSLVSRSPSRAASISEPPFSYPVTMCSQCKRDLLRPLAIKATRLDTHRAPTKGMVDHKAEAERLKAEARRARKEKKRSLRSVTREIGIVGAVKLVLRTTAMQADTPASDDCPRCLKRQRRRVA